MVIELLSISRTYPVLTIILAIVLFAIGFKVARWIMWGIAFVVLMIGLYLIF